MKQINLFLFILLISINSSFADINKEFENWKLNFKKIALKNNISEKTFNIVMSDTKFLSDVIKYDRYQPEFYEDTKTYITKRTSSKKVSFVKKSDLLLSKLNVDKEEIISIFPRYLPKFVSIPINDNNNSLSTLYSLDTLSIKSLLFLYIFFPIITFSFDDLLLT